MGAVEHTFRHHEATSLLRWWHDAGVDVAVSESACDWLGKAIAANRVVPEQVMAPAAPLPITYEAFREWLATADFAESGPASRRLPPTGDPGSELMILADFPDHCDIDAGTPLSGALAELFDKMLSALGRDRSTVYIAALSPGRPMSGRLQQESIVALAEIARHHIALVAPKQLWLMGSAASRAILGIDDAAARGKLHDVNLNGRKVKVIATAHPRFFEGSKARKAAAWTEMQRLMTGDCV
jgi:uracil-DNA glycosylase